MVGGETVPLKKSFKSVRNAECGSLSLNSWNDFRASTLRTQIGAKLDKTWDFNGFSLK